MTQKLVEDVLVIAETLGLGVQSAENGEVDVMSPFQVLMAMPDEAFLSCRFPLINYLCL